LGRDLGGWDGGDRVGWGGGHRGLGIATAFIVRAIEKLSANKCGAACGWLVARSIEVRGLPCPKIRRLGNPELGFWTLWGDYLTVAGIILDGYGGICFLDYLRFLLTSIPGNGNTQ
jgi:hypothetical protein